MHEVNFARTLKLPKGSIFVFVFVFDCGYTGYAWYNHLVENKVYLVIRQKKNACYTMIERHPVPKKFGITSDQAIRMTGIKAE
jgi:hypothetical protein